MIENQAQTEVQLRQHWLLDGPVSPVVRPVVKAAMLLMADFIYIDHKQHQQEVQKLDRMFSRKSPKK